MRLIVIGIMLTLLVSCSNMTMDTVEIFPVPSANDSLTVMEVSALPQPEKTMTVRNEVKGKNVYVECVISGFTFTDPNKEKGDGYIELFLNGKKVDEIYTAAFVMKGLPSGKHTIELVVVDTKGQKTGMSNTFDVTI